MDWKEYEIEADKAFDAASTPDEIEALQVRYLGRKSPLKLALREVRSREDGKLLNEIRVRLEGARDSAIGRVSMAELERSLREETVDVTLPGTPVPRGHLHLITQIRREVEDVFLGMGYSIAEGREVETTHYLFDALNMPPNHPTRSPHHTFYLNGDIVLRTETSPEQIHTMERTEPPIYMITLGRCYRRDTPDATHYPIFHQVEGLAVDRGITLADLKGTLDHLLKALFGEERRSKFVTHYFPFTEPSMEAFVSCFVCDGAGCRTCRFSGWIEIGGSGVVDPNVLEFVGYDPEEFSGFAFGWGLERIAMFRHRVPDIRMLWEDDLRLLEQF